MSTKMAMELIFLRMHLTCREKKPVDVTFMNIFGKLQYCIPKNTI